MVVRDGIGVDSYTASPQSQSIGLGQWLTLRDWFAGQMDCDEIRVDVVVGELLTGLPHPDKSDPIARLKWGANLNATLKYLLADAMLKARAQ